MYWLVVGGVREELGDEGADRPPAEPAALDPPHERGQCVPAQHRHGERLDLLAQGVGLFLKLSLQRRIFWLTVFTCIGDTTWAAHGAHTVAKTQAMKAPHCQPYTAGCRLPVISSLVSSFCRDCCEFMSSFAYATSCVTACCNTPLSFSSPSARDCVSKAEL